MCEKKGELESQQLRFDDYRELLNDAINVMNVKWIYLATDIQQDLDKYLIKTNKLHRTMIEKENEPNLILELEELSTLCEDFTNKSRHYAIDDLAIKSLPKLK